jgi:transcriptional regulator with PAS, ATPase and Fis domain
METGHPIVNKPFDIIDAHGHRKPITISTALRQGENAQMMGGVETFRDMTLVEELRKQVQKQYSWEGTSTKRRADERVASSERQTETIIIKQALRRNDGNRAAAARELDINPSTLFRKLKSLGLDT